jgi:lipopolysaccharide transport system ATP-binding protein
MSDVAVRVENLGKQYRIGGKRQKYRTLRASLTDAVASPFRRAGQLVRGQADGASDRHEKVWALNDVSFEVKTGDVVGIIGRNGAGKSTLLKILSRITEPTTGYVEVFGRVGALLEVGTGFHPELTGRENIYLNGAILGMARQEINHKFDAIVDFAEIEKFIDTPVKHYSSGMGLRLGFAVAAYLEPEILVVDEVLAVGDIRFQQKCLGKMSEVASEGRTVLFVSHNLSTIAALTQRCLLLEHGAIVREGAPTEVIANYVAASVNQKAYVSWQDEWLGDESIRFLECKIQTDDPQPIFGLEDEIPISVSYQISKTVEELRIGFDIISSDGALLFRTWFDDQAEVKMLQAGYYESTCVIPGSLLNAGSYSITLKASVFKTRKIVQQESTITFQISDITGREARYGSRKRPGYLNPRLKWRTQAFGMLADERTLLAKGNPNDESP